MTIRERLSSQAANQNWSPDLNSKSELAGLMTRPSGLVTWEITLAGMFSLAFGLNYDVSMTVLSPSELSLKIWGEIC